MSNQSEIDNMNYNFSNYKCSFTVWYKLESAKGRAYSKNAFHSFLTPSDQFCRIIPTDLINICLGFKLKSIKNASQCKQMNIKRCKVIVHYIESNIIHLIFTSQAFSCVNFFSKSSRQTHIDTEYHAINHNN